MNASPQATKSSFTVVLSAIAVAISLTACEGAGGPPQFPPPEVNVAVVSQQEITEWDNFSGHIEAIDSVEIRPRVTGYLEAVHFVEGGLVEKGDLLFSIDAREYIAAADLADADVARAQTRVDLARQEVERSEKLHIAKAVSQEEVDQRRGEVRQALADLNAAQARARQAQLNVEFSRVEAPISGRIGAALIKPGNLVQSGSSLLTTLVSVDPVYVAFEGDERIYLRYHDLARDGLRVSSRDTRNPVKVGLSNDTGYPLDGEMVFVDNQLDPGSGTIQARAILPNPEGRLTPGLFARVQLLGGSGYKAMLIHEQAVLTDQDRKYVYVVVDGKAVRRDVTLGAQIGGLRVVDSGLQVGDRVVINGTRKIFYSGAEVLPVEVPMDQPEYAAINHPDPPASS
ncbi:MAG: MexE family multidrug efflux RND transporter periplasmic adaptor subunit [Lysobacteraceae bacterium]|nr:MAG: MexE family multidrug efflux RND transporter periplasmic adaptor subunit [Xanthomonadaceae bacterium]